MSTTRDVGCDDFERAAFNRHIIKNELFITGYRLVENWFAHAPRKQPLPDWMPQGSLPQVGKKDWSQSSGGKDGEYEVIEPKVVKP